MESCRKTIKGLHEVKKFYLDVKKNSYMEEEINLDTSEITVIFTDCFKGSSLVNIRYFMSRAQAQQKLAKSCQSKQWIQRSSFH